jgi:hypothetical protein
MTEKQVQWAAAHDWFIAVLPDNEGVKVADNYTIEGVLFEGRRTFTDFHILVEWAGY